MYAYFCAAFRKSGASLTEDCVRGVAPASRSWSRPRGKFILLWRRRSLHVLWRGGCITPVSQILSTNHPVFAPYREGSPLLTDHEFRRRAAGITTDFFVIGLYRDERFIVGRRRGVTDDHSLLVPLSWPERVLLRHRDVPTGEPCECQW